MEASEVYFIMAKKDVNDAIRTLQEGVTKCPNSIKLKTFLKQLSDVTVINEENSKPQTNPEEERLRKEEILKEEKRLRKLESLRLKVGTRIGEEKYQLYMLAHEAAYNKNYHAAKIHAEKSIEISPIYKTIELLDYIVENITREKREIKGITDKADDNILYKSYLDRAYTYIRKDYLNCAEVYLEKWMREGTDPSQAIRASELSIEYLEARVAQVYSEVDDDDTSQFEAYELVKDAVEELKTDFESAEQLILKAYEIYPSDSVTGLLRAVRRFEHNIPEYGRATIKENCVIS